MKPERYLTIDKGDTQALIDSVNAPKPKEPKAPQEKKVKPPSRAYKPKTVEVTEEFIGRLKKTLETTTEDEVARVTCLTKGTIKNLMNGRTKRMHRYTRVSLSAVMEMTDD